MNNFAKNTSNLMQQIKKKQKTMQITKPYKIVRNARIQLLTLVICNPRIFNQDCNKSSLSFDSSQKY